MKHNALRVRAEEKLRLTRRDIRALPHEDIEQLVYELQVHQVELEMQNEELRVSQQQCEQLQLQYRELFDCAPAGYAILDELGKIVRVNGAGRAMLGGLSSVTPPLRAFVAHGDRSQFDAHWNAARRQERSSCEVRVAKRHVESYLRLDMNILPGQPNHCLVVLTDVSERRRSLRALERLSQELEARVAARTAELDAKNQRLTAEIEQRAELEAKQAELEARMRVSERLESLGMLAAGIAHDFNNLLMSVSGNAELVLRHPELTESLKDPLLMIRRAGRLASDLTRQLLIFAGRGQLNTVRVPLPKLVAENLELIRTRVPSGVQLEARNAPELPDIEADRGQINQVVLNLVTNAIEALANAPGKVLVETSSRRLSAEELASFQLHQQAIEGEFVLLDVRDSGPGMDAATQQRIFDPFFSTKFTGRGLGLASVAGIVQSHRGAVRVRSTLGEGTSIEVAFRACVSRTASDRPTALTAEWQGSGPILLIDDDDSVRKVMASLLKLLGFDVTAVASGQAGLQLCSEGKTDFKLIVLDWIMPGMSGASVLAELRRFAPKLPVILISGYSVEDLASYDACATCLQKPMTFEALRDAVRSALAPAARAV